LALDTTPPAARPALSLLSTSGFGKRDQIFRKNALARKSSFTFQIGRRQFFKRLMAM